MRTLFLDIETAPHIVAAWGLWDQNINVGNILEPGYVLCFSAKWGDSKKLITYDVATDGKKKMIQAVWKLLDEADVVCHYNGTKFDIPVLRGEFMELHMPPPSPFVQLDLLKTMRTTRLASRKLDYVCKRLGLGTKLEHKGMALWHGCMAGKAADWKIMKKYNRQDVRILEELYHEIRPWINGLPFDPDGCPHLHVQHRGTYSTTQTAYERLYCTDCKTWIRGKTIVKRSKYQTLRV